MCSIDSCTIWFNPDHPLHTPLCSRVCAHTQILTNLLNYFTMKHCLILHQTTVRELCRSSVTCYRLRAVRNTHKLTRDNCILAPFQLFCNCPTALLVECVSIENGQTASVQTGVKILLHWSHTVPKLTPDGHMNRCLCQLLWEFFGMPKISRSLSKLILMQ